MAHETTYILLLRGINVGGRNKLPTAPFCEQLKSEGFSNVRSYLASGNLLLDSAEPVDVIQEKIRALIRRQITEEGLDKVLEASGFEIRQPGCSACLAMNDDKVPAGKYAVSTSNRNFEGRQGPGARTILASPLVAAACAVTGVITDPRELM